MFICRFLAVMLLTLLVSSWFPGHASANLMNPMGSGDRLGEPIGEFGQLHILREELLVDLRSLTSDEMGRVSATYEVENRGAEATLDLTFISPGIERGTVRLDGKTLFAKPVAAPTLAENWLRSVIIPPFANQSRPWLAEEGATLTLYDLEKRFTNPYQTEVEPSTAFSFRATFSPGNHQLQVTYRLNPYDYAGDGIYREFAVGYLLAPAKTWASFGTLDLQVNVLSGWETVTSLPLDRHDNVLQASFSGIPADGFAIATRPILWRVSRIISIALQASGWIAGLVACWLLGVKIGRRATRRAWDATTLIAASALFSPLGGIMAIVTVILGNLFALFVLNYQLLSLAWSRDYSLVHFILLPLLALILGIIVTLATLLVTRYRKRSL